jgi:putative transcriptional regulator
VNRICSLYCHTKVQRICHMKMDISMVKNGSLLVSEPLMQDSNFSRTVILMCDHQEAGSFGFILNQPSEISLSDLSDEFSEINLKLFIGGPVEQNTLHFIHRSEEQLSESVHLGEGLYWGGDIEQVKERLALGLDKPEQYRFFVGYSGWGADQLKEEIENDSWLVFNDNLSLVFKTEPSMLWKQVLLNQHKEFHPLVHYPKDARLN